MCNSAGRSADDRACNVRPACFIPSPVHMNISKINTTTLSLTWQFSPKVAFSDCTRPYCNGSRRYKVKVHVFDSLASGARPIWETGWLKTGKRRDTFFTFHHQRVVNQFYYYRYSLKNGNLTPQYSQDPDVPENSWTNRTKMSKLCHFSDQGK